MASMGRPLKWNPQRQEQIVNMVAAGSYGEIAANANGISTATYYTWLQTGRKEAAARAAGEAPNPDLDWAVGFSEAVEEARAKAEVRVVANIQRAAADGTWQAGAWWLERTFPDRYSRRTITEVSGREGGPVQVEGVPPEALEAKVKAILATMGVEDGSTDE